MWTVVQNRTYWNLCLHWRHLNYLDRSSLSRQTLWTAFSRQCDKCNQHCSTARTVALKEPAPDLFLHVSAWILFRWKSNRCFELYSWVLEVIVSEEYYLLADVSWTNHDYPSYCMVPVHRSRLVPSRYSDADPIYYLCPFSFNFCARVTKVAVYLEKIWRMQKSTLWSCESKWKVRNIYEHQNTWWRRKCRTRQTRGSRYYAFEHLLQEPRSYVSVVDRSFVYVLLLELDE